MDGTALLSSLLSTGVLTSDVLGEAPVLNTTEPVQVSFVYAVIMECTSFGAQFFTCVRTRTSFSTGVTATPSETSTGVKPACVLVVVTLAGIVAVSALLMCVKRRQVATPRPSKLCVILEEA